MAQFRGLRELKLKLGKISGQTRREVHRALERGAQRIADHAAERIADSGARNNPGPSKPGEYPAGKSGRLLQSIHIENHSTETRSRFDVGPRVEYGPYLEFGTSKMAPRPFLAPSFAANVDQVKADVRAAVRRGVRKSGR